MTAAQKNSESDPKKVANVIVTLSQRNAVPKRLVLGTAAAAYVEQVEAARVEEAKKDLDLTRSTVLRIPYEVTSAKRSLHRTLEHHRALREALRGALIRAQEHRLPLERLSLGEQPNKVHCVLPFHLSCRSEILLQPLELRHYVSVVCLVDQLRKENMAFCQDSVCDL